MAKPVGTRHGVRGTHLTKTTPAETARMYLEDYGDRAERQILNRIEQATRTLTQEFWTKVANELLEIRKQARGEGQS